MSADGDTVRNAIENPYSGLGLRHKNDARKALARLEARCDALETALEEIRDHGDETPCDEECGPYLVSVAATALAEAAPEATP